MNNNFRNKKNIYFNQSDLVVDLRVLLADFFVIKKLRKCGKMFCGQEILPQVKKFTSKFLSLLLVVCVNWVGISAVGESDAYYNDSENSRYNIFAAADLDFSLISEKESGQLTPGESAQRDITIIKEGSLDFQYKAAVGEISGDMDFCQALAMNAHLNGVLVYSGGLVGFTLPLFLYSTSTNEWRFDIILPADAPSQTQNKSCYWQYIFKGWQINMSGSDKGFSDIEIANDAAESGSWGGVVLNEFLPNPAGADSAPMPQGEWVELYNLSNSETINLNGYYLTDAIYSHRIKVEPCRTNTGSVSIAPNGFLVVYRSGVGNDCSSHNFSLNNTGDTVNFYDNTDALIDSYTYEGDAPENKAYARIPDGTGGWVDPVPTPGQPNKQDDIDALFNYLAAIAENSSSSPEIGEEETGGSEESNGGGVAENNETATSTQATSTDDFMGDEAPIPATTTLVAATTTLVATTSDANSVAASSSSMAEMTATTTPDADTTADAGAGETGTTTTEDVLNDNNDNVDNADDDGEDSAGDGAGDAIKPEPQPDEQPPTDEPHPIPDGATADKPDSATEPETGQDIE